jgi:hypothetical protein
MARNGFWNNRQLVVNILLQVKYIIKAHKKLYYKNNGRNYYCRTK